MQPPRTPVTRSTRKTKPPATAPVLGRVRSAAEPMATTKAKARPQDKERRTVRQEKADTLGVPLQEKLSERSDTEVSSMEDREPLKAYLRIRPAPTDPTHFPYLTVHSSTVVVTAPPVSLVRGARPATSYTFTKVFPPSTSQSDFYTQVALPLVQALMGGENGLLFAYGLSGAGKTWTVQGGTEEGEQGLVWRVLRTVLSSVKGQQGDVRLRLTGKSVCADDSARESLGSGLDVEDPAIESTTKVDKNYSYSIFVSYAEVYNEKIFDLLDPVTVSGKRKPLALKSDPSGGKYIHGLRETRVRSISEAHAAFASGLTARQVSGTKVNHRSSRSHAIFSVRVVRVHRGRPADPDSVYSSHLSIVDLAGSERTKATLATGDRLKESGSINKSLMVLGQCMEVLRGNQRKLALAGSSGGGPVKLSLVPFRHSKLTELFQEFFIGEGRAIMVVNVNPYDGGYDEIVNVMRFSALATQVKTGHTYNSSVPGSVIDLPRLLLPEMDEDVSSQDTYEEEDEEDEAEPEDPLVTHLFSQLEEMKLKLYEAELRCAIVESETREEVTREMEGRMRAMERMFSERIMFDAEQNEAKIDSKIDLINRAMASSRPELHSSSPEAADYSSSDDQPINDNSNVFLADDVQVIAGSGAPSLGPYELDSLSEEESDQDQIYANDNNAQSDSDEWRPSEDDKSPASTHSIERKRVVQKSSARRRTSVPAKASRTSQSQGSLNKENIGPLMGGNIGRETQAELMMGQPSDIEESKVDRSVPAKAKKRSAVGSVFTADANIQGEAAEMTMIIPDKKARQEIIAGAGQGAVYVPGEGEADVARKKKRKLHARNAVVTEEKILELEKRAPSSDETRNVRRAARLVK